MNSLSENFGAARAQIKRDLDGLFMELKDYPRPFLSQIALLITRIYVQHFDPDVPEACGMYFKPWTTEQMARHEKNLAAVEVRADLQARENSLDEGSPASGEEVYAWGHLMSRRLMWEMESVPRNGTAGNERPLRSLTSWRCTSPLPFSEDYASHIPQSDRDWVPRFYWSQAGHIPHIKICMYNSVQGDSDQILRAELLTIVATMATRLGQEQLGQHIVIPVMLFSFMGPRHGRILTAHYDGLELVVRMSPLYRFLAEDRDSMLLFTRYLAGGIDPRGDTTSVPED